jgi:hypothetical protein
MYYLADNENVTLEEFPEMRPPQSPEERAERQRTVLTVIEENPQHHNQGSWHCGSSHCYAGCASLLALGLPVSTDVMARLDGLHFEKEGGTHHDGPYIDARDHAAEWLGLDRHEADALFSGANKLDDLRRHVESLAAMQGNHWRYVVATGYDGDKVVFRDFTPYASADEALAAGKAWIGERQAPEDYEVAAYEYEFLLPFGKFSPSGHEAM